MTRFFVWASVIVYTVILGVTLAALVRVSTAGAGTLPASGAVVACGGVLATAVWGLWSRVHNWKVLRFFASILPNEVATVGKPLP